MVDIVIDKFEFNKLLALGWNIVHSVKGSSKNELVVTVERYSTFSWWCLLFFGIFYLLYRWTRNNTKRRTYTVKGWK